MYKASLENSENFSSCFVVFAPAPISNLLITRSNQVRLAVNIKYHRGTVAYKHQNDSHKKTEETNHDLGNYINRSTIE